MVRVEAKLTSRACSASAPHLMEGQHRLTQHLTKPGYIHPLVLIIINSKLIQDYWCHGLEGFHPKNYGIYVYVYLKVFLYVFLQIYA